MAQVNNQFMLAAKSNQVSERQSIYNEEKFIFYFWVPRRPRPKFTICTLYTVLTLLAVQNIKIPFPLFWKNTPQIILVLYRNKYYLENRHPFSLNEALMLWGYCFEGPMVRETKCVEQREAAMLQASCRKLSTFTYFSFCSELKP